MHAAAADWAHHHYSKSHAPPLPTILLPRCHPPAARARRLLALALLLLTGDGLRRRAPAPTAPTVILVKYAARPPRARPSTRTTPATPPARTHRPGRSRDRRSAPRLLRLPPGANLAAALARLRRRHDVLWAVPDYRAHTSGTFIPNDPGLGHTPTGWEATQWNFDGPFGVNAPEAWANVAADGHPGGRGVIVAVLDTGVAYANRGRFRRSPDFSRFQFVRGL